MKNSIRILFLLISVFTFSCEEKPFFVNCDECVTTEPLKAELKINLDRPYYGVTTLVVYTGNLEDNIIYKTLQTSSDQTSVSVTLNQKYTVTATYNMDGTYYIAVDSATPRVTYNKDQCNDPCYYTYDREVDLRLKYTK